MTHVDWANFTRYGSSLIFLVRTLDHRGVGPIVLTFLRRKYVKNFEFGKDDFCVFWGMGKNNTVGLFKNCFIKFMGECG